LAHDLAASKSIGRVTIHKGKSVLNVQRENEAVPKQEELDLLALDSVAVAAAIRDLTDDELDQAASVSLGSDATVTYQFFLEDHTVRHSYDHAAQILAAFKP